VARFACVIASRRVRTLQRVQLGARPRRPPRVEIDDEKLKLVQVRRDLSDRMLREIAGVATDTA
jgi:hypothetical protein